MRKNIILFFCVVLFGGAFLFRHVLTASLLEAFIGGIEYDTRTWDEGKLIYKNLKVGNLISAELAEIDFHIDLAPFYVEPHVSLYAPHVTVEEGEVSSSLLALLVPSRFYGVKLYAEEGTLDFVKAEQSIRLFWAFRENVLSLKDDQGEVLSCALDQTTEGLGIECDISKRSAEFLAELLSFFTPAPLENIGALTGLAEIHAKVDFNKDLSFSKLSSVVELEGVSFTYLPSDLYVHVGRVQGEVHFPCESRALWKKIGGQIVIEGGSALYRGCAIGELNASLNEEQIQVQAMAKGKDCSFPLDLFLQGSIHDDGAFWTEGKAHIAGSSLDFSFCRSEEEVLVLQTEFADWGQDATDLFSAILEIKMPRGTFSGKGTAWVGAEGLQRLCWDKIEAKEFYSEWAEKEVQAFASYMVSSGEWSSKESLKRLSLALNDGHIRQKKWHASHLDFQVHLEEQELKSCSLNGFLMDFPMQFSPSGKLSEGSFIGEVEVRPEMRLQIQSKWKKEDEAWSVCGTAKRENDQLEFGLAFHPDFSFQDGWVHAEKLSTDTYIPELKGSCQFFASFNEEKIEGQIWSGGLAFAHDSIKISIPPQEEPAKLVIPFSGSWDLTMPLKKVSVEQQLLFEEVEGILRLNVEKGSIQHLSAMCCGMQLRGQLDFFRIGKDTFDIRLYADEASGKVEDALGLLTHFSSSPIPNTEMKGSITCGKGGVHLFYHHTPQGDTMDWRISSRITGVEVPQYSVRNLQFNLDYDSSADVFVLTNVHGDVRDYTFSCDDFRYKDGGQKECEFDFILRKEIEEAAKAERMIVRLNDDDFDVQGKGVFLGKKAIYPFHLKGKKLQEGWMIEKGQIGDVFMKGSFSSAELRWKELAVRGSFLPVENGFSAQIFSIEGLPYEGKGSAFVQISPEPKIQNIAFIFTEEGKEAFRLNAGMLAYHGPSKKWQSEEVHLFASKGSEPFKGVFSVKLAPSYLSFQGVMQQGMIDRFRPKQVLGLYEGPFLNVKCIAEFNGLPLQCVLRVNADKDFAGQLQIAEPQKDETLTIDLGPKGSVDKITGSLRGIGAHLSKEEESYRGSIAIINGEAASGFYEPLKKVKGVEFSGLWKKEAEGFSFDGKLSGTNFEIAGMKLKEMTAEMQITPTLGFIKNLSVFDDTMSIAVKQARFDKSKESWIFEIPLLKAQNIRPNPKKPFHIRHLVLSDFRGVLGETATYRGTGSFNFTNLFKREDSLFEIPKEMLRDLGLDLSLLTPARGEVEYELKGAKAYITAIKNTFSEGSKSQFYLPADTPPSMVDFEGNMRLFLRLKQDAVLKWAEPFTIAVEGKFSEPKYSLR